MNSSTNMDLNCRPATGEWIIAPSRIHGAGLFARLPVPRSTRLLEYVGERISKAESLRRCELQNEYIFSLSPEFDLDGAVDWNPARFINHSCEPNCEALLENGRIWIVSIRDISPGDELTFNYGYDLEDYRRYPCHCGARACAGFMVAEEFFPCLRSA